ncbi:MAG: flagellar motor protein [Vicinamibacteraceae bacterium]
MSTGADRRGSARGGRLDVAILVGAVVGIGLVLGGHGLEGGSMRSLLQGAAAVIVFGGTLGAVMLSFPVRDLKLAVTSLKHLVVDDAPPADGMVSLIGRFALRARKDGLLSLEDDAERMTDPFLKRALALAIDGTSSTTLRAMLEDEIGSREELEETPARVFEAAGGYAPTVGILGAVLGLIQVMENLADPSNLGSGIAVAFVATVYGVGSANLLFLPIGSRFRARAQRNARRREAVLEGVMAIQEGLNPRLIDQKLRGLLGLDGPPPRSGVSGRAA